VEKEKKGNWEIQVFQFWRKKKGNWEIQVNNGMDATD
jgi:hypothetical protein